MSKTDALKLARTQLAKTASYLNLSANSPLEALDCKAAIAAIDAAFNEPEVPEGMVLVPKHDPLYSTRQDAKRYRWLKSRPEQLEADGPDLAFWANFYGVPLRFDDADTKIDAAMAAAPSPQEQA